MTDRLVVYCWPSGRFSKTRKTVDAVFGLCDGARGANLVQSTRPKHTALSWGFRAICWHQKALPTSSENGTVEQKGKVMRTAFRFVLHHANGPGPGEFIYRFIYSRAPLIPPDHYLRIGRWAFSFEPAGSNVGFGCRCWLLVLRRRIVKCSLLRFIFLSF